MFKRRAVRNRVFDNLHKGFVITCLGLTCYGCYLLGLRYYRYFTVVRPAVQEKEAADKEELLREGKASSDTSLLIDTASAMKA